MKINVKNIKGILVTLFILIAIGAFHYAKDITTQEITYNEFLNLLEENQIDKVVIKNDNLIITPYKNEKYGRKILYTANINDPNLISQFREAGVDFEERISE